MKKKLALIMTVVLATGLFGGCGSDEGKSVGEMKVEKYVTLGEYKGINVTLEEPTVSDAEVEEHMERIAFSNMTQEHGIKDRAVAVGDTVNIDYEGKKNDVAFAGGTATNQQLAIGSGQFIDGFEDGLVGVMPGETVDLNLTFPENYGNEELNGQAVVFTVTVNYIYPTEYTDEMVAAWGDSDYATVAELKDWTYNYLYDYEVNEYNYKLENEVLEAFMAQCIFNEVPDSLVNDYKTSMEENLQKEASMYGMDADTLCYYYYQKDLASFVNEYAPEAAKQIVALQAVANAEGLAMTDEELEAELLEFATSNGYATVDEFIGDNTREEYKEYYMFEDVLEFLVSNAVVTAE